MLITLKIAKTKRSEGEGEKQEGVKKKENDEFKFRKFSAVEKGKLFPGRIQVLYVRAAQHVDRVLLIYIKAEQIF